MPRGIAADCLLDRRGVWHEKRWTTCLPFEKPRMQIAAWIRKLLQVRGRAALRGRSRAMREGLFPNLFVRQLEERRVLSGTTLPWDDPARAAFDAGSQADDGLPDTFYLVRRGDDVRVDVNGQEVFRGPAGELEELVFRGSGDEDTLVVDHSGGDPLPAGRIVFEAADGGNGEIDSMSIERGASGGNVATLTHRLDRIGSGLIQPSIDSTNPGSQPSTIAYSGVESIRDTTVAEQLVFEVTVPDEAIRISDDGEPGNGDSGDGESSFSRGEGFSITFAGPSRSLDVQTASHGHESVLEVAGVDARFDADLTLQGGKHDVLRFSDTTDLGGGNLTARCGSIYIDGTLRSAAATVHLEASGHTAVGDAGAIDVADSTLGGTGGEARLLGDRVSLTGGATIDVSGDAGGGVVLLGGNLQGENAEIASAAVLFQRVWHKTVVQLSNSLLTGKWQRGLPKL